MFAGQDLGRRFVPTRVFDSTHASQLAVDVFCVPFVSAVVLPFESCKIRIQGGSVHTLRDAVMSVRGDARRLCAEGYVAVAVARGVGVPVYFQVERVARIISSRYVGETYAPLISGALAGTAYWVIVMPFDTVKTHILRGPVGRQRGYNHAFEMVLRASGNGSGGLYRGLLFALARAAPAHGTMWWGCEQTRQLWKGIGGGCWGGGKTIVVSLQKRTQSLSFFFQIS